MSSAIYKTFARKSIKKNIFIYRTKQNAPNNSAKLQPYSFVFMTIITLFIAIKFQQNMMKDIQ